MSETGTAPAPAAGPRRRALATLALGLGALALVPLYSGDPGLGTAPEVESAALAAHSLARAGDLTVTEYIRPGAPLYYAFVRRGAEVYSMEPPASIATFAPFLLPWRDRPPGRIRPDELVDPVASRVAALAVFALGTFLLGVAPVARALLATAALALGTSYWTIAAGGLWTHTAAVLWLAVGLGAWAAAVRRPGWYPVAGAALALAAICRPELLPAAGLAAALPLLARPTRRLGLATCAVVVLVGGAGLAVNEAIFGSWLGGRAEIVARIAETHGVASYVGFSPLHLAGLLLAPSRGLFVYSPLLLFALPGLVATLRRTAPPPLRWMSLAGLASFGLYGFVATWWAGATYGPRYMTDLLPFFGLWLARTPRPARARPLWWLGLALCAALSVGVQALGAATYPCGWNTSPTPIDHASARAWQLRDSQLERCARRVLADGP